MRESLQHSGSSSPSPRLEKQVKEQNAHITPAPELRVRQDACSQVSQSASQAIQQASQQASQSIQQASQQASQSIQQASQQASQASRQASQSASQAIQQAQQSAAQSVDAASRTASSISSSANSVVSSVQASADSAVVRANLAMQSAQLSASLAQSEASKAVLAAAQNGGPTAGSEPQGTTIATSSRGGTITDTQLALAIVGSIIASSLITVIAHLIFLRHRKLSRAARSESFGKEGDSTDDLKYPVSGQVMTAVESSKMAYEADRDKNSSSPHVRFSLFPKSSSGDNFTEKQPAPEVKISESRASEPKSPSLRSWLRHQNGVSPFGPIQLPTKQGSNGPLGGQLKSPLRAPPPPRFRLDATPDKSVAMSVSRSNSVSNPLVSPKTMDGIFKQSSTNQPDRESRTSEWTDAMTEEQSAMTPSSPNAPAREDVMHIPSPSKPVRNTVEWLMDRATFRAYSPDLNSRSSKLSIDSRGYLQPSFTSGLPSSPKGSTVASRTQSRINQQKNRGQVSNPFLDPKGKGKAREDRDGTQPNTPGVGKAM